MLSFSLVDLLNRNPYLTAPWEQHPATTSSFDSDGRNFRKKCLGRWKKHTADISLLAGVITDALQYYHASHDILANVGDHIWTAGRFIHS